MTESLGAPPLFRWCSIFCLLTALMAVALCGSAAVHIGSGSAATASSFQMDMVYRYSEQFKSMMKERGMKEQLHAAVLDWPRPGTPDFYHRLAAVDRHRHASRHLLGGAATGGAYSFYPNNDTVNVAQLGGLHYAIMYIGTPPQSFLVALDTGSDLLWVPCECKQCSPTSWSTYGLNQLEGAPFAVYSPSNSTTSKVVACHNAVCTKTLSPGACIGETSSCTYTVKYVSANTSSSGTIVQDVLLLNSERSTGTNVSTNIYFGCGDVQTGTFLQGGAPDGLLGLGPEVYSVPTIVAKNLKTANVFSMCFNSDDGSGRLVFGRKAGTSLQSTPLVPISPSLVYVVEVAGIVAAGVKVNVSGNVIFDTGTSFTTLPSDVIKAIGDALSMNLSMQPVEFNYNNTLRLSYCWNASTISDLPSLSITFAQGAMLDIKEVYLGLGDSQGNLLLVCLGILDSGSVNASPIIGYNFMGGYEFFFDQDDMKLSWGPSNCYTANGTSTPQSPVVAPEASRPIASAPSSSFNSPKSSTVPPPSSGIDLPVSPSSGHGSQSNKGSRSPYRSLFYQLLFVFVSTSFFLLCR